MDRNALKVQALLEKISLITARYENELADARVDYTLLKAELEAREQDLAAAKAGPVDESVPENPEE